MAYQYSNTQPTIFTLGSARITTAESKHYFVRHYEYLTKPKLVELLLAAGRQEGAADSSDSTNAVQHDSNRCGDSGAYTRATRARINIGKQ